MTVEEVLRPMFQNVTYKGYKAHVDIVVLVMYLKRRIVGDEYIHAWKRSERGLHL